MRLSRSVIWSRAASRDLDGVLRYLAEDNPQGASRVTTSIRLAGTKLGTALTGRPGRVKATYEKSVPGLPYVIAYALHGSDGGETVQILRVLHTSRDWSGSGWPTE